MAVRLTASLLLPHAGHPRPSCCFVARDVDARHIGERKQRGRLWPGMTNSVALALDAGDLIASCVDRTRAHCRAHRRNANDFFTDIE